MSGSSESSGYCVFAAAHTQDLFEALKESEYGLVGPILRDGAIVYDEISSPADLPVGWTEEQDRGTYRLKRRTDEALFGYAVGPSSWKRFLFPPFVRLWRANRNGENAFEVVAGAPEVPRYAFLGVRPCDLHAIAVQDRVFLEGRCVDPAYQACRDRVFIVAVNCGQAGGSCFCVSMQTGPRATSGFDLALTEILEDDRHEFLVEIGTPKGAEILDAIPHRKSRPDDVEAGERAVARAASQHSAGDRPRFTRTS